MFGVFTAAAKVPTGGLSDLYPKARVLTSSRTNCQLCVRDRDATQQGAFPFDRPLWLVRRSHCLHHRLLQGNEIPEDQPVGDSYAQRRDPCDVRGA